MLQKCPHSSSAPTYWNGGTTEARVVELGSKSENNKRTHLKLGRWSAKNSLSNQYHRHQIQAPLRVHRFPLCPHMTNAGGKTHEFHCGDQTEAFFSAHTILKLKAIICTM
jgi:hypothetical protein